MIHEVEINITTQKENILFDTYGVFLLGTNLIVAQGFLGPEEAEAWIEQYNSRFQKPVLEYIKNGTDNH